MRRQQRPRRACRTHRWVAGRALRSSSILEHPVNSSLDIRNPSPVASDSQDTPLVVSVGTYFIVLLGCYNHAVSSLGEVGEDQAPPPLLGRGGAWINVAPPPR